MLHTPDLGSTWQAAGDCPGARPNILTFSLATRSSADGSGRCWIAGSPGTRVFFTDDGGRTWQTGSTGQSLPIRDLTFVHDWHGWAVGDLGLILATEDGGRTWQRQRSGGGRAALAGFYAHAAEVPWELLAQVSGDDGYMTRSRSSRVRRARPRRCRFARRGSRGASRHRWQLDGDRLAIPGAQGSGAIVGRRTDRRLEPSERRARARSARRLPGAQIRIWRPSVVLIAGTTAAQPADKRRAQAQSSSGVIGAESSVIAQAVLGAVERAADPTRHSGQIVTAGLQPWKVDKVFSGLPEGQMGVVTVNTTQVSPRVARWPKWPRRPGAWSRRRKGGSIIRRRRRPSVFG